MFASISIREVASLLLQQINNEMNQLQTGRYLSTIEAAWRIFSFAVHDRSSAIQHLTVPLENGQRVGFTEENARERILDPKNITLMAFLSFVRMIVFKKTFHLS